ncbi:MAG: redoxin domain-containing protein, partial [Phycisphaerae bacterium]
MSASRSFVLSIGLLVGLRPAVCAAAEAIAGPEEVLNFRLLDHRGRAHELRRIEGRAVVLFFTANGCPVVRQSMGKLKALQADYQPRGVRFLLVNANSGDDRAAIRKEMYELDAWQLPVLKDETQGLARHLGVKRTAETIAVSTRDWRIFYRGAVDDQLAEGAQKPKAGAHYLREALEAFLADRPVTRPTTVTRGCVIHYEAPARWKDREVSYSTEVAPLLAAKCVSCHSKGNVGSWSMNGYARVKGMSAMIQETLLTRRMPPWDADPVVGRFANDCSLTTLEAQTLLRWIEQGAPRGEGPDPLEDLAVPPQPDWPLGEPDIILKFPRPQKIPATGVLDYRHVEVRAGNEKEGWVGATYIRPGNRRVVHHVIARLKEGGVRDHFGMPEMYCGWAPGTTQTRLPEGTGKFLPRQARFDVEVHYTTCGAEQTDDTQIGLYLLRDRPKQRFESVPLANLEFEIAPGAASTEVFATYCLPRPAVLHALTPHMHLRGRWMKFELLLPDGKRETVASIPHFDFNWQRSYV